MDDINSILIYLTQTHLFSQNETKYFNDYLKKWRKETRAYKKEEYYQACKDIISKHQWEWSKDIEKKFIGDTSINLLFSLSNEKGQKIFKHPPKIVSIFGKSNSGRSYLLEQLIKKKDPNFRYYFQKKHKNSILRKDDESEEIMYFIGFPIVPTILDCSYFEMKLLNLFLIFNSDSILFIETPEYDFTKFQLDYNLDNDFKNKCFIIQNFDTQASTFQKNNFNYYKLLKEEFHDIKKSNNNVINLISSSIKKLKKNKETSLIENWREFKYFVSSKIPAKEKINDPFSKKESLKYNYDYPEYYLKGLEPKYLEKGKEILIRFPDLRGIKKVEDTDITSFTLYNHIFINIKITNESNEEFHILLKRKGGNGVKLREFNEKHGVIQIVLIIE